MIKNFKRVEKLKYGKQFFKIFVDKNNSVYDILSSVVTSWKFVNNKKFPDKVLENRDLYLFNKIKGNPAGIAMNKVMAEIDYGYVSPDFQTEKV